MDHWRPSPPTTYRPHAAREDTDLFPKLKDVVSSNEYDAMAEDFEKKEHELFGEDGFEKRAARVAQLEQQMGIHDLGPIHAALTSPAACSGSVGSTQALGPLSGLSPAAPEPAQRPEQDALLHLFEGGFGVCLGRQQRQDDRDAERQRHADDGRIAQRDEPPGGFDLSQRLASMSTWMVGDRDQHQRAQRSHQMLATAADVVKRRQVMARTSEGKLAAQAIEKASPAMNATFWPSKAMPRTMARNGMTTVATVPP